MADKNISLWNKEFCVVIYLKIKTQQDFCTSASCKSFNLLVVNEKCGQDYNCFLRSGPSLFCQRLSRWQWPSIFCKWILSDWTWRCLLWLTVCQLLSQYGGQQCSIFREQNMCNFLLSGHSRGASRKLQEICNLHWSAGCHRLCTFCFPDASHQRKSYQTEKDFTPSARNVSSIVKI